MSYKDKKKSLSRVIFLDSATCTIFFFLQCHHDDASLVYYFALRLRSKVNIQRIVHER